MKQWKDMNLWEKFGVICMIFYYIVGVYTVVYNITLWTFELGYWISGKIDEWNAYWSGRKVAKEISYKEEV